jgi:hypothetical protein
MSKIEQESLQAKLKSIQEQTKILKFLGWISILAGIVFVLTSFSTSLLYYFDVIADKPDFAKGMGSDAAIFVIFGSLFLSVSKAFDAIKALIKEMEGIV